MVRMPSPPPTPSPSPSPTPSPTPEPTPEPTLEPEVTAEAKAKRGSVWTSIGEITTLTLSFEYWFSRKTTHTIIQVLGETKDRIGPLLELATPVVAVVFWLNMKFEKSSAEVKELSATMTNAFRDAKEDSNKQFADAKELSTTIINDAKVLSAFVRGEFKEIRSDVNDLAVDVGIIIDRRREHPPTTRPTRPTPPTGGDSECPICGTK